MAEGTEEYLSVSSFNIRIDGFNWETYESVTGLGVDIEDIPFQSDKKMMLNRPGRFNARDLTLIRRFKNDKELYNWIKNVKDGKQDRKSGSIVLKDDEENDIVSFEFFGAWPKSWSGPQLSKDSAGNDILKEEVTLSVQDIEMK